MDDGTAGTSLVRRRVLGAALLCPLVLQAADRPRVVGFLTGQRDGGPGAQRRLLARFAELGFARDARLVYHARSADLVQERLPALARELLTLNLDVLVAYGIVATRTAAVLTRQMPIFGFSIDPIADGWSSDGVRPTANVAGCTDDFYGRWQKMIELLRRIMPGLSRFGLTWPAEDEGLARIAPGVEKAGAALGLKVVGIPVDSAAAQAAALDRFKEQGVQAFQAMWLARHADLRQFGTLAAVKGLAWVDPFNDALARHGALLEYGAQLPNAPATLADQVVRYFRGTPLAQIPFERPSVYRLELNRTTALKLGLRIPPALETLAHVVHA